MAEPTAPVPGANGKLYRSTGTWDSPVYVEMENVRDVEFPLEWSDQEVTSRASGRYRQHEPTLADIAGSLTMLHNPADEDFVVLRDACINNEAVEIMDLDGPEDESGSTGYRMLMKIFKWAPKKALDGIMEDTFDLKLCYSENPPEFVTR